MKCPMCGKNHNRFPQKCATKARIMGGVDHAHIICVCSKEEFNYDTFLERDDIPFEWKEGLRKAKAMEEYLKERFPENPEGLKEVC